MDAKFRFHSSIDRLGLSVIHTQFFRRATFAPPFCVCAPRFLPASWPPASAAEPSAAFLRKSLRFMAFANPQRSTGGGGCASQPVAGVVSRKFAQSALPCPARTRLHRPRKNPELCP